MPPQGETVAEEMRHRILNKEEVDVELFLNFICLAPTHRLESDFTYFISLEWTVELNILDQTRLF